MELEKTLMDDVQAVDTTILKGRLFGCLRALEKIKEHLQQMNYFSFQLKTLSRMIGNIILKPDYFRCKV